jgi:hypothetical protein
VVRRWLASLLPECPARDHVISVATELCSNAVRDSASGRSGVFAVDVTWHKSVVRVTVADGGSPTEPHVIEDPYSEQGRGLLLVLGLSMRSGVSGDARGRVVWADIAWDGPDAPADTLAQDSYETDIRAGQTALARRFAGVPADAASLPWDQVDVLVPNEIEARALQDVDHDVPAGELAGLLSDRLGVPTVAVTLGASGCALHTSGLSCHYPAHQAVAVDTTGAGDAFTATFAAYVTAGASEHEAVDAAQATAARAVQHAGGHDPTSASAPSI